VLNPHPGAPLTNHKNRNRSMTTFQDGPAKGRTLLLRRSPIFLRVTQYKNDFDALDSPDDWPGDEEIIYAYRRVLHQGTAHINRGSRGGGWYPICEYAMVKPQPEAMFMRSNTEWAKWCEVAEKKLSTGDCG
jgi:hypothetical protein